MINQTNETDGCLSCCTSQIAASNDTFRATQSNGLAKKLLPTKKKKKTFNQTLSSRKTIKKFNFCFSFLFVRSELYGLHIYSYKILRIHIHPALHIYWYKILRIHIHPALHIYLYKILRIHIHPE
jgi:hypothetical protein